MTNFTRSQTLRIADLLNTQYGQINVYNLLSLLDKIESIVFEPADPTDHDSLVQYVLTSNSEVMTHLLADKKINAVKVLRQETRAGLKEAKDAVEDGRVTDHVKSMIDLRNKLTGDEQ